MWGKLGFNFFQIFLEDYFAKGVIYKNKNGIKKKKETALAVPSPQNTAPGMSFYGNVTFNLNSNSDDGPSGMNILQNQMTMMSMLQNNKPSTYIQNKSINNYLSQTPTNPSIENKKMKYKLLHNLLK